jgi:cytochrome c oxidase cbb3-type subunit IV
MDINLLRSLVTSGAFILFVALVLWTFWPTRKAAFEEAAALPFISK